MANAAFSLAGRSALVTGASSGIGQRMAGALTAAGADVVLLGRRRPALEQTAADIERGGGRSAVLEVDLGDRNALTSAARRAAQPFGDIDILVNAAGVNLRQPADQISWDSWDRTLHLNLAVPFFLARELIGAMAQQGWGRIINLASLQSVRAFKGGLAYGASKGGVAQLTRAMAQEWSGAGVNCNAIAPGFFPTPLTAPVFEDPEAVQRLAAETAIGRNGELEDLDGLTVFLASPASDYITGQVIFIDGGFTAK